MLVIIINFRYQRKAKILNSETNTREQLYPEHSIIFVIRYKKEKQTICLF